ncbi:hypothetical protein ACFYW1_29500 [Streptomyces sp. NPDC002669]|uniref:hypothetical protein n=1 Tax=Streptomyces sp. NPDC002669 TaxID=3364658 RepID=UPI0036B32842
MNPRAFIADLKKRITAGLGRLSGALADGSAGGVKVAASKGEPWITVPKLEPLAEPAGLAALKDEVTRRWDVLDLLSGRPATGERRPASAARARRRCGTCVGTSSPSTTSAPPWRSW